MVKDPEWVFKIVSLTKDFAKVCQEGIFLQLKAAFLTYIYLHPKRFTFHMDDQAGLERMIAIVPDQESKLRLYYQLLTLKTPIQDIIEAQHGTPGVMNELKEYVSRCVQASTLKPAEITAIRGTVALLLKENAVGTESYTALQNLQTCLEPVVSRQSVALMGKNFPKEISAEATLQAQQPILPTRSGSN